MECRGRCSSHWSECASLRSQSIPSFASLFADIYYYQVDFMGLYYICQESNHGNLPFFEASSLFGSLYVSNLDPLT